MAFVEETDFESVSGIAYSRFVISAMSGMSTTQAYSVGVSCS